MSNLKPLVIVGGVTQQLQSGDVLVDSAGVPFSLAGQADLTGISLRYLLTYTVVSSTPGSGNVFFHGSDLSDTTVINAAYVDNAPVNWQNVLAKFIADTRIGYLYVTKENDATKWALYAVTGFGTQASNRTPITVSYVSSSGATDIANSDQVVLTFIPQPTLGTIATQDANSVSITGGSITGITDLAVADGGTGASTASGARTNLGLGTVATLASDTDGTLAANSDSNVATQKAVKTYVDQIVTGLFDFKGSTDTSGNPNYPAALKGDAYVVTVAGKIGGASGVSVDVGDMYVASADNAGGTQASVGTSWFVLEHNLVGALLAANNLSDVASASSARTNLGLGTIAVQDANNVTITGGSVTGITDLTVADGGTGSSTAGGARTNLGLVIGTDVQAHDAELDALAGLTSAADKLPYFTGSGTAALTTLTSYARTLVDDVDAAAARTTLGLGTIATQDASNVTITGGSVTGITDLTVADGGTGASTAAGARTNLGLGTAAILDSDTDGTFTANSDSRVATQKATKTYVDQIVTGLFDFKGSTDTSGNPNYPSALKGDAYAVSVAGKIGGASGKSVDIGDVYVASADNAGGTQASVGTSWFILEHNLVGALLSANNLSDVGSASSARTNLGLGTIATQDANNVTISGGSVTGITDLTVADGGTGSSTASGARTNLGLVIGTDVQAHDAELDALAGLTSAADKLPYFTGSGTAAVTALTSFIRTLLDDADAATARATLNAVAADSGGIDVKVFVGNGTWTKPLNASVVYAYCLGGGGGGGAGRRGANTTARGGGGGGGGGGLGLNVYSPAALGATEAVVVGSGGTGAPAISANSTNGTAGNGGGNTTFNTTTGGGGGGGGGGTTAAGGAGAGGTGFAAGGVGGAGGTGATPGADAPSVTASLFGIASTPPRGGGGGGGVSAANVASAGGLGGSIGTFLAGGTAGAVTPSSGGAADTLTIMMYHSMPIGGAGGGGGGAHASVGTGSRTGGAGGVAGRGGGGGGGGGAGLDSVANSGAGGDGDAGIVIIVTRY